MARPDPDRTDAGAATPARWRVLRRALATCAAVGGMVLVMVVPGTPGASAVDEYGFPTWAEVEAARGNEAAKGQQIEQIRGLIAQLETDLANAQAYSEQKAGEAIEAQTRYDEQVAVADRLQEQADEAAGERDGDGGRPGRPFGRRRRAGRSGVGHAAEPAVRGAGCHPDPGAGYRTSACCSW